MSARVGVTGDLNADLRRHGGADQAVHAYASEDLRWWAAVLGGPVPPGLFGENLTTAGLDLADCVLGERWRIGSTELQVTSVRLPCASFQRWLVVNGLRAEDWVRRFTAAGRSGVYLRVTRPGRLSAGDPVDVLERPPHGVTALRALTTEPALLPLLLEVDALAARPRRRAERYAVRVGA